MKYRFWSSNFYSKERNWKDAEFKNHLALLKDYVYKEIWVWDADICGDDTYHFAISDGTGTSYYMLEHSWWMTYDPEWEIHNTYTVDPIEKEEMPDFPGDRDWLKV